MTAAATESAIAATRALAASFGIACDPTVIADRSHLVLALDPAPIVARVALSTSTTRIGLDWLAREVAIARHLDAAFVPTTRPVEAFDPGPHEVGELIVSFWHRETEVEALDPAVAGPAGHLLERGEQRVDARSREGHRPARVAHEACPLSQSCARSSDVNRRVGIPGLATRR